MFCILLLLRTAKCELVKETNLLKAENIPIKSDVEYTRTPKSTKTERDNPQFQKNIPKAAGPSFLSSGFHDFVSSDQGPTYSYEITRNNLHGSPNYIRSHHGPQDRLPQNDTYKLNKPYQWYYSNLVHKFLTPEDRLPLERPDVLSNASEVQQIKQEKERNDARKHRKSRFIRNYLENRLDSFPPHWESSDSSSFDYSTQDYFPLPTSLKNMVDRNDPYMNYVDSDSGLPSLFDDPLAKMVVVLLPVSVFLAAATLPVLTKMMAANGGVKLPFVSTTATGNNFKTWEENITQFQPLIGVGTVSPRGEGECIMRELCEVIKMEESVSLTLQQVIHKVLKYIDDKWLHSSHFKTLVESLKDGTCEKIQCSEKWLNH